jgi:hypothetical protein
MEWEQCECCQDDRNGIGCSGHCWQIRKEAEQKIENIMGEAIKRADEYIQAIRRHCLQSCDGDCNSACPLAYLKLGEKS